MIATELILSKRDCTQLNIKDAYSIHKVVYSLFPQKNDKTRDFIYCDMGENCGARKVIIISKDRPLNVSWGKMTSKEISKNFLAQEYYAFSVTMNPVVRNGKTHKLNPVCGHGNLIKWFHNKCASYGFSILPDTLAVDFTGVLQFERGEDLITLNKVTFKGRLHVNDHEKFIKAFSYGIGKGRAFGLGLIQLAPLNYARVSA